MLVNSFSFNSLKVSSKLILILNSRHIQSLPLFLKMVQSPNAIRLLHKQSFQSFLLHTQPDKPIGDTLLTISHRLY